MHDVWAPSEEAMTTEFETALKSAVARAALTVTPGRIFPKPRSVIKRDGCFAVVDGACFEMCRISYEDGSPNPHGVERLPEEDARALAYAIANSDSFDDRGAFLTPPQRL